MTTARRPELCPGCKARELFGETGDWRYDDHACHEDPDPFVCAERVALYDAGRRALAAEVLAQIADNEACGEPAESTVLDVTRYLTEAAE
jgi:hypothetical protein